MANSGSGMHAGGTSESLSRKESRLPHRVPAAVLICHYARTADGDLLHWISALNPCIQSAEQRTHACNPSLLELQRHPGAGRFVGSSAVEDDVAISRDLDVTVFELLWRQP